MANFRVASAAVLATTGRGHHVFPEPSGEPTSERVIPTRDKRGRRRRKSREVSIEMFTNNSTERMPTPQELAAEGNLEDLKQYIENLGVTIKDRDENGATLLHHAAANNQITTMQYLIVSGIDLNAVDGEGNTALHLACDKGLIEPVRFLLGAGASDTVLNKSSDAPIHLIMKNNDTETLKAFLEFPVDILVEGYRKRTPLHVAAEKDCLEVCETLHTCILTNARYKEITGFRLCASDEDDLTPIHFAARCGSYKVLRFFFARCLEHGYSPEVVLGFLDEENSTPLHAAVDGGHLHVVEVLLSHKASADTSKGKQLPPFLLASTQGKLSMMKLMVEHCGKEVVHCRDLYGQTALHRCANAINSGEIIRFLADNGAEVDSIDDDGRTPLVAAIKGGSLCGVKALLEKGASIFIKDKNGLNPLHYAVKHKRKFILTSLLKMPNASQLVTDCDGRGSSPIHHALMLSQNHLVASMVTAAAQQLKNVKDVNGNNYLHLAAGSGDWKALSILLEIPECYKLLNETNKYGGTPLHLAAGGGHVRAVEILLANGAMVHKCYSGNTPFLYACLKGHAHVAKITFEAHPFQLTWTDDLGNNALHQGAQSGCWETITLLLNIGVPVTLNNSGETFLDIIIGKHLTKCAMAVINHERWQECLDVCGPNKDHPMIYLIQWMPEVARMVLDRSRTTADVPPEAKGYWESYDFKYIRLKSVHASDDIQSGHDDSTDEKATLINNEDDHMSAPAIKYKGSRTRSGASPKYRQKTNSGHLDVLQNMVRYNRVPLLTHRVTESYLKSKWRQYGRWVQMVKITFIVMQIIFLMLFTFLVPSPVEMRQNPCAGQNNCTSANATTVEINAGANVARFITIGFTAVNLIHWLVTVIRLGLPESLNVTRNTFILVDILSVIFTFIFTIPWTSLQSIIWEAGAMASFTTWFSLVLTVQLFDLFGVYITMFLAISRTVFQVLLICFFFIVAFAMSLYILVGNTMEFSTFGYSMFTNFGYLLGEIDYAYFVDKDAGGQLYYSALTFIFVIIIAIIMAIVIQNLLIGLAVGDIDLIKQNAIAETRAIEIGFYKRIDTIFPRKLFWRLDKGKYTSHPNKEVLGIRYAWRYLWRSIKGEDPNKGDDNSDAFTVANSNRSIENEVASINQRIDELAVSQEKVLDLLSQILSSQQQPNGVTLNVETEA